MENLNNHESDQSTPDFIPEFHLDEETFTAAVEQHQPGLLAFGISMSRDQDTAEDYLGDVFERTWRNRGNLHEQKNVRAYLYTSVRNAHFNAHRKPNKDVHVDDEFMREIPSSGSDNPQEIVQYQDFYEAFEAAVDKLPGDQSEAARARLIDDLSPEESQLLLGSPTVEALNSQLYRARKKLQEDLKDWLV